MCGDGVGIVLLADRVGLNQGFITFSQCGGLGQIGLGARLAGFRTGQRGCIRSRINREKRLAGLDVTAFLEQPLLQNAGSACPDLRHAGSFQPAGQLSDKSYITQLDRDHADFGGRRAAASTFGVPFTAFTAACNKN
ncbi:hypothetical protein D9M73_82940 [compost metagenome]